MASTKVRLVTVVGKYEVLLEVRKEGTSTIFDQLVTTTRVCTTTSKLIRYLLMGDNFITLSSVYATLSSPDCRRLIKRITKISSHVIRTVGTHILTVVAGYESEFNLNGAAERWHGTHWFLMYVVITPSALRFINRRHHVRCYCLTASSTLLPRPSRSAAAVCQRPLTVTGGASSIQWPPIVEAFFQAVAGCTR